MCPPLAVSRKTPQNHANRSPAADHFREGGTWRQHDMTIVDRVNGGSALSGPRVSLEPTVNSVGRVCAVCVTYNPDPPTVRRVLEATLSQVDELVVVDNGSRDEVREKLIGIALPKGCCLVLLDSNLGVAAGLNRGMRVAQDRKCDFVLLLDQDSIPGPGMVKALLDAYLRLKQDGILAAGVGPQCIDPESRRPTFFVRFSAFSRRRLPCRDGSVVLQADVLITSGSLIPIWALGAVGMMDEDLFIDHVDTDWCLRARARGYPLFGVCSAVISHSLGDGTRTFWLFGTRAIHMHSPLRMYYYVRNGILLARKVSSPWVWTLTELSRTFALSIGYVLLVSPRRAFLRMILLGLLDGVRGRRGPLPGGSKALRHEFGKGV